MVNERVIIINRKKKTKKIIKFFLIIFGFVLILSLSFLSGFFLNRNIEKSKLKNPLENFTLVKSNGTINNSFIYEDIPELNKDFIDYLLIEFDVSNLHNSFLGEPPIIELEIDEEFWTSEIIKGIPNTEKEKADDADLLISVSEKDLIEILMSEDLNDSIEQSIRDNEIQFEMIATKIELFSKGYLEMYNRLIK